MLDVSRELVCHVSRLLAAQRRARGTRRGARALTPFRQAMFVLAWFRKREDIAVLGAGFGISRSTASTLADAGYDGAGIGVHTPVKQPSDGRDLDIDTRTRNALLRGLRCLAERGFALLTGRWRALHHFTTSPEKIGDIVKAALVLTHFEHGRHQ
ncbi:hypothetical protein D7D52_32475 [Nocardia yunnanensis]|uniref:DDE Tnp4 domain-containing protein n=2 Tax=Nocardia yunnanensis TaxID=2382165 RepID=A0A386ZQ45_9NOCA|nr:transposase family protein [Nocardia yunnanensis]AYF79566.1 hypothetical protein D7D52_32475 [Nocardia yunnanensis]